MSDERITDVLFDGKNYLPIVAESDAVFDVLDRQPFIDNILQFINQISLLKGTSTIAINGAWGSGKSFVLNQIEKQLRVYQDGNRYLVIHYNCWQFDYYEEPLIAIVSIVKESLEKQANLFPSKLKEIITEAIITLKEISIGVSLLPVNSSMAAGIPIGLSFLSNAIKTAKDDSKKNGFDSNASFNAVVKKLKTSLATITKHVTIVFAVDEIDRCLPSYAIKVLERLHHLFSELPNSVVLITEDKEQLTSIVAQIFGSSKPDEYLRKFINFSFYLDKGKVNDHFPEKYQSFFFRFKPCPYDTEFGLNEFCSAVFSGIPIRRQEQLMDNLEKVHELLFPETEKDYLFLCLEILLLVFSKYYRFDSNPFRIDNNLSITLSSGDSVLSEYISNTYSGTFLSKINPYSATKNKPTYQWPNPINIPKLIVCAFTHFYYKSSFVVSFPSDYSKTYYQDILDSLQQVDKLLSLLQ